MKVRASNRAELLDGWGRHTDSSYWNHTCFKIMDASLFGTTMAIPTERCPGYESGILPNCLRGGALLPFHVSPTNHLLDLPT